MQDRHERPSMAGSLKEMGSEDLGEGRISLGRGLEFKGVKGEVLGMASMGVQCQMREFLEDEELFVFAVTRLQLTWFVRSPSLGIYCRYHFHRAVNDFTCSEVS